MTPPKRTDSDEPTRETESHPSPCSALAWRSGVAIALLVFAFGLASSATTVLWNRANANTDRITASETAAAALAARVDERLRAIEASQGRMERTLESIASRTRSGTTLGSATP